MPKTPAHGTRSRYVSGCTDGADGKACDPCKLAEANYHKGRRRGVKANSNVIPLVPVPVGGDALNGSSPEILVGPTEQGVIDVLIQFPAIATERPDLAASARAMARLQDSALTSAQATNAAARMIELMDRLLKGTQKKRKLAAVRQMTNPGRDRVTDNKGELKWNQST